MKTSKFKTNAKCDGCVARIADKLNEIVPREQWNIDLSTTDRVLTVTADVPDEKIIAVPFNDPMYNTYKAAYISIIVCICGYEALLLAFCSFIAYG